MIKPTKTKKRKTKKRHGADVAAEADMIVAIRGASYFVATLFVGHGEYSRKSAPTVLAALDVAREIEQDPRAFTRRATISAVGADNVATLLTKELIDRLLSTPTRKS